MKTSPFAIVKAVLFGLLSIFLILFLVFGSWVLWERNRDTLAGIDFYSGKVEFSHDTTYNLSFEELPERTYRHIALSTEYLGNIEAFISEPTVIPTKGIPVVIIMGGLEVDADIFRLILDPGDNIYVIFKYPYTPEYWYEGAPIVEIPVIRKSVLNVPSQALALHQWVSKQPWSEKERVTFAGFSFGAMFLPAIYHLADSRDEVLNPGVIAYAGADISDLLYTNMGKIDSPWRSLGAWLGETAIYGIEPARHLPYMNNEFLLINGTRDHQISTYSWEKLHRLIPQPKTVVILDDGHMHPRKPELTKKLVKISREWLLERGLIN
jgi:pimeloyl-ACP methyl ester carboxylesterase